MSYTKQQQLKIISLRQRIFEAVFKAVISTFPFNSRAQLESTGKRYRMYRKRIITIDTNKDSDFYELIEHFISSLRNSHTRLKNYPNKTILLPTSYTALRWDSQNYLIKGGRCLGQIVSIDGLSPQAKIRILSKRLSYSTDQSLLYRATRLLLGSLEQRLARIVVRNDKKSRTFVVRRSESIETRLKAPIERKILPSGVGYVRIKTWKGGSLKQEIAKTVQWFRKDMIRGVIIDVRGNSGGDSKNADLLASHLVKRKTIFCKVKKRAVGTLFRWKPSTFYVVPRRPYINKPLVLLVDSGCMSSTEYFVAGLKDSGRALVIGEKTGGGSGNPKLFIFPYKGSRLELFVSTWLNYRKKGLSIEGLGIEPTIIVRPTKRALLMSIDVVLNRALHELSKILKFY